jgi:tripartite-type tricarboxylate transporter receptor subunit TctC
MLSRSKSKMARTLFGAALLAGWALAGVAWAQAFPSKPIRIVLSYTHGGPTDLLSRLVGEKVSARLGQPVLVESRAGANERIATSYVLSLPSDGYTILLVGPAISTNPSLFDMKYDAQKEMTGLIQLVDIPPVLYTHPDSGIRSLADLVKLAKSKPGEVNYGTAGNATNNHLTMELISQLAGVKMQHIPLKGDAPVIVEVLANRIHVASSTLPSVLPDVKAGRLRALAVASRERSSLLPEVPTLVEQGIDAVTNTWFGFVVNAGTPPEIVKVLNAEFDRALQQPDVREKLAAVGMTPVGGRPEQFTTLIRDERERWGRIIQSRGIKVQ